MTGILGGGWIQVKAPGEAKMGFHEPVICKNRCRYIDLVHSEESFPGLNCLANIFVGENSEMTCQFIRPGG